MELDLLWTDICFFVLLMLIGVTFVLSLRKPHIRLSLISLGHRPVAVSAGIVLFTFLAIAIIDSIHLKSTNGGLESAESCLDKILSPMGSSYEKTYSAPLALTSFVSEMHYDHGVMQQIYPRLHYPPQTIKTDEDKVKQIQHCLLWVASYSTLFLMGASLLMLMLRWCYPAMPTAVMVSGLLTLTLVIFLLVLSYRLSRSFHVLGTGQIGQDIFYYTIKSVRTGFIIGFLTTFFMLPFAVLLGIIAGYFGKVVDDIIQYIYTTLSSIPSVLLITASVLSLQIFISNHPKLFTTLAQGADARLLALCFILGVTSWTSLCRLLRAEVLKLREVDYVLAAQALGSTWWRIISTHLLPNVMHIIIITVVLDFSFLVMAEAVLSYVGVGVSPLTISWGNMINSARLELARDPIIWWPIFAAFLFMFLLVLALNLFADAVRDAFDPRNGFH